MNRWQTRSLKFRLACLSGLANLATMGLLAGVVFVVISNKMRSDLDDQLQQDFRIVLSGLEYEDDGIEWELSEHERPGDAPPPINFSVWSTGGQSLMAFGQSPAWLPRPVDRPDARPAFLSVKENGLHRRILDGVVEVDRHELMLRVHRDQRPLEQTLGAIAGASMLLIPLAVLLAGIVGYLVASRSLAPVNDLCRQAKRITAHSLNERLSTPNPHDEIGQLAAVCNQTFARLENAFDEMQRFTSDASHELRTPLTSLRAVGEVALRDSGNPGARRDAIASMLEEAERLNDLIVFLLELARGDVGQMPDTAPVNPGELMAEVVDTLAPLASERNLKLRVTGQTKNLRVTADQSLLRQAVLNIVHNAIVNSPPDSDILLRSGPSGNGGFIEITDHGPGIAEQHQERVFDRFYRVDKARSRASGGFGLGLSIARSAVERMGGTITLQSKPGEGATFRIHLPLAPIP